MLNSFFTSLNRSSHGAKRWLTSSDYMNRDAISLRTLLLVSPLGLFAGIRFENASIGRDLALNLTIGVLTFACMGVLLWLSWLLVYHSNPDNRMSNVWLVVVGFVAGGSRGGLTEFLAAFFFEEPINFEALVQRVCTSGVAWAIAMPVFAEVNAGIREFKNSRDKNLSILLEQERTRAALLVQSSQNSSVFKSEIKKVLTETFGPLRASIANEGDIPRAKALDEVLDRLIKGTSSRVREISHDISSARVPALGKLSASRIIKSSLFFNQINLPTTLLIVLLANFVSPLFKAGLIAAIGQAIFGGLVSLVLLWFIRNFSSDARSSAPNVLLASLSYAGLHSWLQLEVYQQAVSIQQQQTFGSLFVLNFLVLFFALIISGLQQSSKLAGDEFMAKLERSINRARLESHLLEDLNRQEALELSEYLHGYLQSQLMAISIQLNEARRACNEAQMEQLLVHVKALAEDPLSSFGARKATHLREGLERLAHTWAGILEIDFKVEPGLEDESVLNHTLALQVIEEAISNAYRHGAAARVKVSLNLSEPDTVHLVVIDDGAGPDTAVPGLGFKNFARISGGRWNIVNNPFGTGAKLEMYIPSLTT